MRGIFNTDTPDNILVLRLSAILAAGHPRRNRALFSQRERYNTSIALYLIRLLLRTLNARTCRERQAITNPGHTRSGEIWELSK